MRAHRTLLGIMAMLALASTAIAQSGGRDGAATGWRAAGGDLSTARFSGTLFSHHVAKSQAEVAGDRETEAASPIKLTQHTVTAAAAAGSGNLVGRQSYPIRAYTQAVQSTRRPQQAVIDWILRETGYETWHGDVEASLSADENEVRVTHTAEMQRTVKGVVDRFTNTSALSRAFGVRVITLDEPDWRARAFRSMKSIPAQSPGVAAWLLERENAATLLAELAKRSDYREPPENNAQPLLENGQAFVLSSTRSISYLRDISPPKPPVAGPQPLPDQLIEGLALEFSPLLSADNRMVDAVLKCHIDQVEALKPVMVDVPVGLGVNQSIRLDVPQVSQYRLQERYRWPVDQVLLVSLGVVPSPYRPAQSLVNLKSLSSLNLGEQVPTRCEVLVFVECKGKNSASIIHNGTRRQAVRTTYHHRY